MSLKKARKLLIKKLHARILALYEARPEGSAEWLSDDETELSQMFGHYFKLKNKDALEEEALWKNELQKDENIPTLSQILVTPNAYKQIMKDSENSRIKTVIEKAICFSINNTFYKGENPDSALTNLDCTGTGYLEPRANIGVKVMWEKGNLEKRIIVIHSLTDEPCYRFWSPHKWQYLFRKCLPLNVT